MGRECQGDARRVSRAPHPLAARARGRAATNSAPSHMGPEPRELTCRAHALIKE